MSFIVGLRTLIKLKTRRLDQLSDALKDDQMQLQDRLCVQRECREDEARCRANEASWLACIDEATNGPSFSGADIVLLQHLAKEASDDVKAAAAKCLQADHQVTAAEEQVRCTQRALRRCEQQLERCSSRLQAALDHAERSQEDIQDEESEEASVARMLASAKAGSR